MRRALGHSLALVWTLLASGLASGLATGGPSFAQEPRGPGRRALLVAIEHYPPEVHWPTLEGPAPDVAAMHDALVARFGFKSEDVEELHDAAATHAGIAAALDRLVGRAAPGDLILFYFAGHGSRLPDDDPDEESDGWDETLVPYDACVGEKRDNDIRDDEIGQWIARANLKTDQVVLVFDCCSSGTNVRDESPGRSRYLSPEDRGVAVSPSGRGFDRARTVALPLAPRKLSGWVPPRVRCVALSACRAQESAFEVRVEASAPTSDSGPAKGAAGLYRGLFTMCLIDELSSIDSEASWRDLMLRVSARVAAKTTRQTPVIEGALAGYGLFRSVAPARAPHFEADLAEHGRLRIHGGFLQGLAPGAVLAVCSPEATRDDAELRLGEAEIVDAVAGESIARWRRVPVGPNAEIAARPGPCNAFLLQNGESQSPLPVSIEGECEAASALGQALEATRLVRRVDPREARFRIAAGVGPSLDAWRVLDAKGRALSDFVEVSEAELPRLLAAMSTLARAWRTEQILPASGARDLQAEVSVRILGEAREDGARPSLGEPAKDGQGRWRIPPGLPWCVSVVNRSEVPVYANLVLVFPDGEIVVPCPPGPDDRLRPGGAPARCQPGEIVIPAGREEFYEDEPVRLYCVLTPRWHDLSALAQDAFSTGPGTRGAESWSSAELANETWACVAMEIAVR